MNKLLTEQGHFRDTDTLSGQTDSSGELPKSRVIVLLW